MSWGGFLTAPLTVTAEDSGLFVYGDSEGFQEALILGGEADPAIGFDFVGFGEHFVRTIVIIVPLIESDGGFEDEKNVVARTFDLTDGFGDTLRI